MLVTKSGLSFYSVIQSAGSFGPFYVLKIPETSVVATADLLVYYEQEFCYVYVFYFIYPRVTFLFVGGG